MRKSPLDRRRLAGWVHSAVAGYIDGSFASQHMPSTPAQYHYEPCAGDGGVVELRCAVGVGVCEVEGVG